MTPFVIPITPIKLELLVAIVDLTNTFAKLLLVLLGG